MIDGAGPWQRLRLVIVPIILPVIEITFLLGFVFTVKVFDLVIGMTGGGPANATQLIIHLVLHLSGFKSSTSAREPRSITCCWCSRSICAPLYLLLSRDRCDAARGGTMTRLQKKTACDGSARSRRPSALAIMLFPIYAIVVGSFESTITLFSTTFHFLPYHPTLANYRDRPLGTSPETS